MACHDARLEHLRFALTDCQEVIRAVDLKASVLVAVMVGLLGFIGATYSSNLYDSMSTVTKLLFGLGSIALMASFLLTVAVLYPISNPLRYVTIGKTRLPDGFFYLSDLVTGDEEAPLCNILFMRNVTLAGSLAEVADVIKGMDAKDCVETLSLELMKTSFIRNRKLSVMGIAFIAFLAASLLLVAALSFHILYHVL
jgi:hypothetical protein